jgi:protein-S-isoprenylcysteine O-methyltransferase Ste14
MFKYVFFILVFLAFLNRYLVSIKVVKMEKIKGEILAGWITKLVLYFYMLVFIAPIFELIFVKREMNYYISVSAFAIYIFGMIFWQWAIGSLNKYWSMDIEIREEHSLIKSGPYKYMRHPHYLFIFCELLGLPLVANAYYSFILMAAIYIPLITLRIIFEERALIEKFGEEYLKYKKEVWGVFPFPIFKSGVKG